MTFVATPAPRHTLAELIDTHGTWTTLVALLRVLAERRQHRRTGRASARIHGLTNHVRRDIGLPPEPAGSRYWEVR